METNASEDVVAVEHGAPSAAITGSLPAAPLQSPPKIQEARDAQVITRIRQRRQEALERIKKVGQQRRSATEEAVRGYQPPSEEKKMNRRDSSTGPRRTSPPPPAARSSPPPHRGRGRGRGSGNGGYSRGGGFLDEETQLAIALSMSAQEARGETTTLPDEVVAAMMMTNEVAEQERRHRAARARAHDGGSGEYGRRGIPHWMLAEDPIEGMMEEMTRSGSDTLYDSSGNAIDMSYENLVNLEDVPTPLSNAIKARIPTYTLDAAGVELRQKEGTGDCPVCLMGYEDGDEVAMLPSCAHEFHKDCVFHWFESRNKCPVCRAGFDDM